MSYKITIEETKTVRGIVPKQWKLVGDEHNAKHGYTEETETVMEKTERIYEQTVEKLDLKSVIDSVNK